MQLLLITDRLDRLKNYFLHKLSFIFLCIKYKIVITVGFEYLFETQFELMQQFNWGSDHSLSWFPWPAMYPKSTLSLYRLTDFLRGNVKSWILKKCLVTRAVWTLYTQQPGCWNVVVNWLIKKVNFVWTPHLTTPLAASSFTRSPPRLKIQSRPRPHVGWRLHTETDPHITRFRILSSYNVELTGWDIVVEIPINISDCGCQEVTADSESAVMCPRCPGEPGCWQPRPVTSTSSSWGDQ